MNREKVIKGLEIQLDDLQKYTDSDEILTLTQEQAKEIVALLKEQEAVKPLAKEDDSYECICGAIVGWEELDTSGIVQTRLNYCPFCGKPIDWESR